MSDFLELEYKGYTLQYQAVGRDINTWEISLGNDTIQSKCLSMADAKKAVDKILKKARTFKELEVWYNGNRYHFSSGTGTFTKVRLTSFAEDGSQCWISIPDKSREKVSVTSVFSVCKYNDSLIAEIGMMRKSITLAEEKIETKEKLLIGIKQK